MISLILTIGRWELAAAVNARRVDDAEATEAVVVSLPDHSVIAYESGDPVFRDEPFGFAPRQKTRNPAGYITLPRHY